LLLPFAVFDFIRGDFTWKGEPTEEGDATLAVLGDFIKGD
jgi:hypothetical protein